MSENELQADAVVIGAGLGGLGAAGYLAKAGKKVIVLEHHRVPGGYAHEFVRGDYRFEVALHAMDGVTEGGWVYPILQHLDVIGDVPFHRLDPFYTAHYPEHEITVSGDKGAYLNTLKEQFPDEAGGLDSLVAAMEKVAEEVGAYVRALRSENRPPMEEMPVLFPNMVAAVSQNWQDYMDAHIKDRKLQGIFTTLWGYYGLPPGKLCACTFILPWVSYHHHGAWYPEGGSMAVSERIAQTIRLNGGEIHYRHTVERILVEDGRAVGVETNKGLRVRAEVIISNASPRATFGALSDPSCVPDGYQTKVDTDVPSLSNLVVYVALDRDLVAEGWKHHEYFDCESYDINADYEAAMKGDFAKAGLVITNYTPVDPTNAPPGKSVVMIMCLAPWDYADQWGTGGDLKRYSGNEKYRKLKDEAGDLLLERAERFIPGLRDSIIHKYVATPLTNYRYSLNPGGTIYGGEQTVGNHFMGRIGAKTPVENLFLCGAWVTGGGMSSALISGRNTAQQVLARCFSQ
jgi:all-trans-retinol 13,14-reductase